MLTIGKNIPLDQSINWISNISKKGLVEFVPKEDSTVLKNTEVYQPIENITIDRNGIFGKGVVQNYQNNNKGKGKGKSKGNQQYNLKNNKGWNSSNGQSKGKGKNKNNWLWNKNYQNYNNQYQNRNDKNWLKIIKFQVFF